MLSQIMPLSSVFVKFLINYALLYCISAPYSRAKYLISLTLTQKPRRHFTGEADMIYFLFFFSRAGVDTMTTQPPTNIIHWRTQFISAALRMLSGKARCSPAQQRKKITVKTVPSGIAASMVLQNESCAQALSSFSFLFIRHLLSMP